MRMIITNVRAVKFYESGCEDVSVPGYQYFVHTCGYVSMNTLINFFIFKKYL